MEKIKITNANQFEKLMEALGKNPSPAGGFRRGSDPTNFKEQWESVANALNAFGPPNRMSDGWQKILKETCGFVFRLKNTLISFGNVLVSYTAYVEDCKLIDRHKLSVNERCEIDDKTLSQITSEAIATTEQNEPKLGGSAINIVCILKNLGTKALFFGACGKDDQSEIIFELLRKAKMDSCQFKLQAVPNTATGRQVSLVHKESKTVYRTTDASATLTGTYLQQAEKDEEGSFLRPQNRKQILYIEGFFVPKCEAVTTFIVRHYLVGRRCLALNLSTEYIVKKNFPHMLFLVNNSLFIFGKRNEFEAFRECWGASSIKEFAVAMARESKIPKVFVITNGAESVEMITNYSSGKLLPGNLTFYTFHVSPADNAINTSGCGDAFVAAFLHEWLKKSSLSQCVRKAICFATKSIQNNDNFSYQETAAVVQ